MKAAFNIKVGYGEKQVTLTILPAGRNYFKVIYFGAIMAAVRFNSEGWDLIEREELEPGNLPLYEPELKGERLQVVLNEAMAGEIGEEIESYLSQEEEG